MPTFARALRYGWVVLGVVVLFPLLRGTLASPRAAAESATSGAPTGLTCEAMEQPLGIGVTQPRLSWRVNDSHRGAVQTGYEIRVASTAEKLGLGQATVWDSGK